MSRVKVIRHRSFYTQFPNNNNNIIIIMNSRLNRARVHRPPCNNKPLWRDAKLAPKQADWNTDKQTDRRI